MISPVEKIRGRAFVFLPAHFDYSLNVDESDSRNDTALLESSIPSCPSLSFVTFLLGAALLLFFAL